MRTSKLTLFAIALLLAGLARAQTNTYNFPSGTLNTTVPTGDPVGIEETATVSGVLNTVNDVQVNLDITGGFNGDLYAYIVGPGGQMAILLNRVGVTSGNAFGYGDAGFNITLDDSGQNIHDYQSEGGLIIDGQLTSTWAPDGRNIDPQSVPGAFDSASTAANLGLFNNVDPTGTWTLFIADLSSGGSPSDLVSWGLTVVTVPEPQTWAMIAGGAGMLLLFRKRSKR